MTEWLLSHEPMSRALAFVLIFIVVASAERLAPRRLLTVTKSIRWTSNIGLVIINTFVVRLLVPLMAAGIALVAENQGWGLLNLLEIPTWAGILLAIVLLDLAIYLQHVVFHFVPILWRLHRMHHADIDIDITTGLRFHPLEILLSMLWKMLVVLALGLPVVGVVLFEIILNATSMFNHANWRLSLGLDRILRWIIVTPDMHRVHHSIYPYETNSNYGFNLPWWDRLFGTYRNQPQDGHEQMTIGLKDFRNERDQRLSALLVQPWKAATANYPNSSKNSK